MSTDTISPSSAESRSVCVEQVNTVIDYIETHLADDLSHVTLAEVAHFSPYHFQRVFSTLVGETLSRFINRLRIERTATLVIQHPRRRRCDRMETTRSRVASTCAPRGPDRSDAFGT